MVKLGLIAFANDGGLGAQTRRLYQMLEPAKTLVIDAREFSPNKQHHIDWYTGENVMVTRGFPRNHEVIEFIEGLTHVFTCENPYNFYLVKACQERGIKVICQTNYEFCENLDSPWLPVPDLFLMPSYWKLEEMKERFGEERVKYLPPPIDPKEFDRAAQVNFPSPGFMGRTFLHIVGTLAWEDRNGTLDLIKAVELSHNDYRVIIRSQHKLPGEYISNDRRISYEIKNFKLNAELYMGFDALLLPRRYGGLSLTTNEALMSGLPVVMPDISPNNKLLPMSWLVPATKISEFKSRALIDVYGIDVQALANKLDDWTHRFPPDQAMRARQIALENFDMNKLKPQYEEIIRSV